MSMSATAVVKKVSVGDLSDADLKGKKVLVRCDLNVPLNGKEITDDTRIRASIPTVEYLLGKGARVALSSHLGRPKDGPEDKFSLAPVATRLTELLGKDCKMAPDCIGAEVQSIADGLGDGEVMLLENVRFYPAETKNDPGEGWREIVITAYVCGFFGRLKIHGRVFMLWFVFMTECGTEPCFIAHVLYCRSCVSVSRRRGS